MSERNSQVGNGFLRDVFLNADPDPTADLLARHDALLQRCAKLERAIERTAVYLEKGHYGYAKRTLEQAVDG